MMDSNEQPTSRGYAQNALNRYALAINDGEAGLVWSVGGAWSAALLSRLPTLLTGPEADALLARHPNARVVDVIVYLEALRAYNAGVNSVVDHNTTSTPESRKAAQEAGVAAMVRSGFCKDALDILKH